MTLAMVHEGYEAGHMFVDRQERGPFRRWRHEHRVEPIGDAAGGAARCELRDHIDYALPMDAIARHVAGGMVTRRLDDMFAYRAVVLTEDLARHAAFAARPRMRVAVTGASGTIGRTLCAFLTTGGHQVVRLVRRAARGPDEVAWDPDAGTIDAPALEGIDAVVHLAGENVGDGRWTDERKRQIMASRVGSTELIANAIRGLARKPSAFVVASAVGYYGEAPAAECDERSPPGDDFLAQVVIAWEAAARKAAEGDSGIRVVQARIGVALTPAGGALAEMARAFDIGIGGPIGRGTQPFPWVARRRRRLRDPPHADGVRARRAGQHRRARPRRQPHVREDARPRARSPELRARTGVRDQAVARRVRQGRAARRPARDLRRVVRRRLRIFATGARTMAPPRARARGLIDHRRVTNVPAELSHALRRMRLTAAIALAEQQGQLEAPAVARLAAELAHLVDDYNTHRGGPRLSALVARLSLRPVDELGLLAAVAL